MVLSVSYGLRFVAWLQVALLYALVLAPWAAVADHTSMADTEPPYSIEISKGKREMLVSRLGKVVRRYQISTGSKPGDKLRRGDKRTPVGRYTVREVRPSDRYHVFMHLDYPGMHDAAEAYQAGRIDAAEYNAFRDAHANGKLPPQNTLLGGQIGIHGLGSTDEVLGDYHALYDWTKGCVAVTDDIIEELERHYVRPGTVVTIRE